MKRFYQHTALVSFCVLLTLAVGTWLMVESGRLTAAQRTYETLDAGLADLHGVLDAQLDIEAAYRGTLMTGSAKALEQLRAGTLRWQAALSKARTSLAETPVGDREITTLGQKMGRYFLALDNQLQNFRGGGALADIEAHASGAAPGSPYLALEAEILAQRAALTASMGGASARIHYLGIGLLISTLAACLAIASCLIAARRQITAMQETLSREIVHDTLTGLANRRYLHAWLQAQISFASRMGDSFHVLYLDLDGFERINDEYGRATGDEILIAAAQRLKTTTRGGDFVARQVDDEFVIVFSCEPDSREIGRYAARLIRSLGKSMIDGVPGGILSASIGVASFPADGTTADDLVAAARTAMLQAKRAGKACYAYRRETSKPDNAANVWEVSRF